jgi:hypothetical protein
MMELHDPKHSYNLATVMWRPTNLDSLTGRYTSQARIRLLYQRLPMQ